MKMKQNVIILALAASVFVLGSLISHGQPYGKAWGWWGKQKENKKEEEKAIKQIKANSLYFENTTNFPLQLTVHPMENMPKIGPEVNPAMKGGQVINIPGPSTGRFPIEGTFGQQGSKFELQIIDEEGKFDQESLRMASKSITFDWRGGKKSFTQDFLLKPTEQTGMPMKDMVKLLLYVEFDDKEEGGTIRMSLTSPFNK